MQGLCCCVRAFSSCGERGLLSSYNAQTSHCGGFSCWLPWWLLWEWRTDLEKGKAWIFHGPPCILLICPTTSKRPDIIILNEARTLTQAKDVTHSGHPACHGGRELWFHPGHILLAILGRGLFQYLYVSSPGVFSLSCV